MNKFPINNTVTVRIHFNILFKEKKYKDALEAYETEENQKNWDPSHYAEGP